MSFKIEKLKVWAEKNNNKIFILALPKKKTNKIYNNEGRQQRSKLRKCRKRFCTKSKESAHTYSYIKMAHRRKYLTQKKIKNNLK